MSDVEPPVVPGLSIGRLLGQGGSSSVWLATDDEGRRFALKIPIPSLPARDAAAQADSSRDIVGGDRRGRHVARPACGVPDGALSGVGRDDAWAGGVPTAGRPVGETAIGDIERELTLLQRFSHEHLLGVYGVVETSRGPGLLTDLAAGGSLQQLVTSRGPLPLPEVVTSLVPVAQVIHHLHQSGALHGDVTPGNIIFTTEGKPLLADFATGRLLGSTRGIAMGTQGFVDPFAHGSFDPGGDVFALAAVAWFALTGRVPGPTEQRPPLAVIVPDVPPALMQLIEDSLSSTRARRPTADQFARALLGCATPGPVNLVPAVHVDVLPELLTRRADSPSTGTGTGTGTGTRTGTRTGSRWSRRRRLDRRGTDHRGRQLSGGRDAAPVRGRRIRHGVALAAGAGWAVLLLAAIVLAIGGTALTGGAARPSVGGESAQRTVEETSARPASSPASNTGTIEGSGQNAQVGRTGGSGQDVDTRAQADDPGASRVAEVPAAPIAALEVLAALRAEAFADADPALLERVDVAGSPALSTDQEAVTALADSGRSLRDLSIAIRDPVALTAEDISSLPGIARLPAVAAVPADTDTSVIRATAALSSYRETDAEAAPLAAAPGSLMAADQQELIFILWDSGDGWRIHSVVAPPD